MKPAAIIAIIILVTVTIGCQEKQPTIGVANFPDAFLNDSTFSAKIVVDDYAPDNELIAVQNFVQYLDEEYNLPPDTSIQYKHVRNIYGQNTIFIGTCAQQPHNKFVNLFVDCLSMEDNIAIMRWVEKGDIKILEVVGKNYQDTEEALYVLIHEDDFNLNGREIQVRGSSFDTLEARITG